MCPPHDKPFPPLDTLPSAPQEALDAEIARATARENEIASGIAPAVTAAASGIEQSIRNDLSGVTSGIAATAATAMSNSQQAVTIASQARQVANAAESTAAARAATVASGIAASVATSAAESVVENSLDRIDYEYDRKLGVFARRDYVDACLKQAVQMTQSPDGLSQIQVTNSGVPTLKVKTGNTLTHPWKTVVRYSTAPTVTYLGVGIQLPAELYFGWNSDYEATATSGYRIIAQVYVSGHSYQIRDLKIVYGEDDDFSITGRKVHVDNSAHIAASEDFTLCSGSFNSANSGFTVEHYDTETYPEVLTTYLVTEQTLGSLEARIAALEAAQS